MGTPSIIAATDNGVTRSIYCHFDGYLSHNGRILHEYYQDPAKVQALLDLGNLSVLGEKVAPLNGVAHSYNGPRADGVTVAYHRDRGSPIENNKAQIDDPGRFMVYPREEYTYLYDGERWLVWENRDTGWRALANALATDRKKT